jgi:hypothetical protein
MEFLEHFRGSHAQGGIASDASSVGNGFADTGLAQAGFAEAQHVALFLGESAVEELLDDAWLELGAKGKVEAIEATPFKVICM